MIRTTTYESYKKFKEMGIEVELVEKELLDVLLQFGKIAPRGSKKDGIYQRYYILNTKSKIPEIAHAINEFNQNISFDIKKYDKYYSSYKISIL